MKECTEQGAGCRVEEASLIIIICEAGEGNCHAGR